MPKHQCKNELCQQKIEMLEKQIKSYETLVKNQEIFLSKALYELKYKDTKTETATKTSGISFGNIGYLQPNIRTGSYPIDPVRASAIISELNKKEKMLNPEPLPTRKVIIPV